jgi:pimeloyl-ACP methyl ester carboxylesterase
VSTDSSRVDRISTVQRRFDDQEADAPPLVLLRHFRPGIRSWDPAVVDIIGSGCEVALFDNGRAGGPTGVEPDGLAELAWEAVAFIDALDAERVDLIGFSLGGHVAQEVALLRPRLVRRLVLAASGPSDDSDLHLWAEGVDFLTAPDAPKPKESFVLSRRAPLDGSSRWGNVIPLASHRMALRAGAMARQLDRGSPRTPRTREPRLLGPTPSIPRDRPAALPRRDGPA